MCGIAGIVGDQNSGETFDLVNRMMSALAHRGPDASGIWQDDLCTLGHRRLAIIDLSEAGRQPLSNHDKTIWIVFNGEIYNFQILRAELESLGYRFRTGTDTEAIIYAYEQWGADSLKKLRGMFALALWDQKNKRLLLARDRIGKKPLFYGRFGDRLIFGSELQAVLADQRIARKADAMAIDAYLAWGYIPAPGTAFEGIRKLPPAHWMTYERTADGKWKERIERYWSLEYQPKLSISENEAIEVIREKLTEAVRLRLISDVPLGAFLSGGIDSSIVVGLMSKISDSPVKTFSIGFEEAEFDETEHAQRIATLCGTDHQKFVVQPKALEILPMLVRHYGEPYADSSAIPTFYVSQLTRSQVTVALNGDGGDESFAGYERYLGNRIAEGIRKWPGHSVAAGILRRTLPDSLNPKSRLRQMRRFLTVAAQPMATRYGRWIGYFNPEAREKLYNTDYRKTLNGACGNGWMERLFAQVSELDAADAAMAVDVVSYLPFDLLVKVDITSMANGLEARSPFLDHEVMEFAARLPSDLKLNGTTSKYLLKRAFSEFLPPENVKRRKMGFGVPVGEWFRGPLRQLLNDTLLSNDSRTADYINKNQVRTLVDDHLNRHADNAFPIWNLLMLEMWHREFGV